MNSYLNQYVINLTFILVIWNKIENFHCFESLFWDSACKLPHLKIDDPEFLQFFKHVPTLDCDHFEPNWVIVETGVIKFRANLSETHLNSTCNYTGYSRGENDAEFPVQHDTIEFQDNFTVRYLSFTTYVNK